MAEGKLVSCAGRMVRCLDARTGARLWCQPMGGEIGQALGVPVFVVAGGERYVVGVCNEGAATPGSAIYRLRDGAVAAVLPGITSSKEGMSGPVVWDGWEKDPCPSTRRMDIRRRSSASRPAATAGAGSPLRRPSPSGTDSASAPMTSCGASEEVHSAFARGIADGDRHPRDRRFVDETARREGDCDRGSADGFPAVPQCHACRRACLSGPWA